MARLLNFQMENRPVITAGYSASERSALFHDNASRLYRW
ncbi:hypothetical protein SF83666_a42740 (plasmid) [Sinorhizobium fredii CCBAU 83666]|nr:hypothetical protein SF83666_a42740 [Sinorhizobium fredii CCBAU 83666]